MPVHVCSEMEDSTLIIVSINNCKHVRKERAMATAAGKLTLSKRKLKRAGDFVCDINNRK